MLAIAGQHTRGVVSVPEIVETNRTQYPLPVPRTSKQKMEHALNSRFMGQPPYSYELNTFFVTLLYQCIIGWISCYYKFYVHILLNIIIYILHNYFTEKKNA